MRCVLLVCKLPRCTEGISRGLKKSSREWRAMVRLPVGAQPLMPLRIAMPSAPPPQPAISARDREAAAALAAEIEVSGDSEPRGDRPHAPSVTRRAPGGIAGQWEYDLARHAHAARLSRETPDYRLRIGKARRRAQTIDEYFRRVACHHLLASRNAPSIVRRHLG